jgi:excisionase family DNA binding protein
LHSNAPKIRNYTHEEVFGHLRDVTFSAKEAAEFLEVSLPTLRRYVQAGRLKPSAVIGRSQLFISVDLRLLKQKLNKE